MLGIASCAFCALYSAMARSQVTTDGTLPQATVVTPVGSTFNITGGIQAGSNLFHSFKEFSIPTGGTAFFQNAADIQNIFSRVTGGSVSNIDGLIRTSGAANLFLINPSGIIFGRNASVNIGGSFIATTASRLKFANGTEFSAANPQTMPLLTVNVPVGLQYGVNPGSILNQSQAIDSNGQIVGLQVQPGKTLALVGGDVSLNDGTLQARGGRVELGGLSGGGTVGLSVDGNDVRLSFPNGVARADVSLYSSVNNASKDVDVIYKGFNAIDVFGGGSAVIHARHLQINSSINAGETLFLSEPKQAGNIMLNATGEVSLISAGLNAMGRSGAIDIQAGSISSKNSVLSVSDFGGVAGTISISANDSISAANSFFVSAAGYGESSGNINIQAKSISLTDGSTVNVTATKGVAGDINIRATDFINISGRSQLLAHGGDAYGETVFPGMGGNIDIRAGSLTLSDGARVDATVSGKGASGNINIQTDNSLSLFKYSYITNSNVGQTKGGDITIKARSVSLANNSQVQAFGGQQGSAGNILVEALDSVTISGDSRSNANNNIYFYNGLFTGTQGSGRGGDITIRTGELRILDGAVLNATTKGDSNGGNIKVDARTVEIANGGQILTTTFSRGNAGNIIVNASDSITISGRQNPFDFYFKLYKDYYGVEESVAKLIAEESVNYLMNSSHVGFASGVFASSANNSTGQGGNLKMTTGRLEVLDGAELTVSSKGSGTAGSLQVRANSIRLNNGATLKAETTAGQGNINLRSGSLILRRGSSITTNATGSQVIGGDITIDTDVLAAFEDSDISANSADFRGGNVRIKAQGIFGTQFRDLVTSKSDITATGESPKLKGTVELNTPDINHNRGLVQLPTNLVDVSQEIDNSCNPDTGQRTSSFVMTGRSGLPPSPLEMLTPDAVQADWVTLNSGNSDRNRHLPSLMNAATVTPEPIVEATEWTLDNEGHVLLTARESATRDSVLKSVACGSF